MDSFTIFHFYLIFFLLGLGYTVMAVLLGQLLGGHDGHDGGFHDVGEHGGLGDGHDGGADGGFDVGDAMPTLAPLSPVTVATFATSFGGTGIILDRVGLPGLLSFPAATGSGFVIAAGVFYLFYRIFGITQGTSSVSSRHAVGREAQVITPIPAEGVGEIAYVLGGRRFNSPARSESGCPVAVGESVTIARASAGVIYVRESVAQRARRI